MIITIIVTIITISIIPDVLVDRLRDVRVEGGVGVVEEEEVADPL